jgi:hypothetical protein
MDTDDHLDEARCCGNCHFWACFNQSVIGQCNKFPPTAAFTAFMDSEGRRCMHPEKAKFPTTVELDWCGEWRKKHSKRGEKK